MDPVDWPRLSSSIDCALSNPALPRAYRGFYEAWRAADEDSFEAALARVQRAKGMMNEMRLAYQVQGKENEWIETSRRSQELGWRLRQRKTLLIPSSTDPHPASLIIANVLTEPL